MFQDPLAVPDIRQKKMVAPILVDPRRDSPEDKGGAGRVLADNPVALAIAVKSWSIERQQEPVLRRDSRRRR